MHRSSKIALAAATVAAAALAVAFVPRDADALTATSSFSVTATVATACKITSANITAAYDPNAASATTANGSVTLNCTKGTHYDVGLVSSNAWKMVGTGGSLGYTIYQGSSSTPWTDTGVVSGVAVNFGTPVVLTATASIPPGQDVPAGSYVDSVTATVTF
jgi:spore coat protein U-like protein